MKKDRMDGKEIVEQLIENSASFHQKTKFSQAKFLKKKSKKYSPYVMIKKPSIRLLMQINYKNDPMKMMNLRIDTLAQILNNANIRSGMCKMLLKNSSARKCHSIPIQSQTSGPGNVHVQVQERCYCDSDSECKQD